MKNGFTLIEVVVAMSVLLIGGLAAMQLMVRTQHTVSSVKQKFVALSVAREGLELARAVRDTNWFLDLGEEAWAVALCSQGDETQTFTLDSKMVRDAEGIVKVGDVEQPVLYESEDNGEWTHEVSSKPTGYERTIQVVCRDQHKTNEEVIEVSSRVTWYEGGTPRTLDVRQKLYNWLYTLDNE